MGTIRTHIWHRGVCPGLLSTILLLASGCAEIQLTQFRIEEGTVHTGSMSLSEDTRVILSRVPSAAREDVRVLATLSLERRNEAGKKSYTDIEIRKVQGGYAAETQIQESGKMRTYMGISHTKDEDWMVGLRMRWRF